MSFALDSHGAFVSRLRVRGRVADPLLTRLRASVALSSAALAPPGLSPAAILVVRRLDDPLPGRLPVSRPGAVVSAEWENAVRTRMATIARRALRPARGPISDSADAVVFSDESEMLTCLARDWVRGGAIRWWWRTLFPNQDLASALVKAWSERPACMPAALAGLSGVEQAAFASRVPDQVIRDWLHSILEVRGLGRVRAALAPLFALPGASGSWHSTERNGSAPRARDGGSAVATDPPWRAYLSAADASILSPLREAFLGVSLLLAHTSRAFDTERSIKRAKRWVASLSASTLTGRKQRSGEGAKRGMGGGTHSQGASDVLSVASSKAPGPHASEAPRPLANGTWPSMEGAARVEVQKEPREGNASDRKYAARIEDAAAVPAEVVERETPACIETRFGGLFFLINLGLFLELYADFSSPARPGIELPIWDFVALVGQDLVGRQVRDDPVWGLLAQLAGRADDEEPGAGLTFCTRWRVPPALSLTSGVKRARAARRRVSAKRWLARMLPYLRHRLEQALDLVDSVDVANVLLRLPARVHPTPTRLDVQFALADLPIEVRLSGLDRDPGWVPAAGRDIRFHFD